MWQFYQPPAPGVNGPVKPWKESLQLEAANQVVFLRQLLSTFKARDYIPDQSLLAEESDKSNRIQALKGPRYVLVYSAGGLPVKFNTERLPIKNVTSASWFDPRTGQYQPTGTKLSELFESPESGKDWVLVIKGS